MTTSIESAPGATICPSPETPSCRDCTTDDVVFGRPRRTRFPQEPGARVLDAAPDLDEVHSLCPERQKEFDLRFPIVNAGRQVQVHVVGDLPSHPHGPQAHIDRHSPGTDDDLFLTLGQDPPTQGVCPEPGCPEIGDGRYRSIGLPEEDVDRLDDCRSPVAAATYRCLRPGLVEHGGDVVNLDRVGPQRSRRCSCPSSDGLWTSRRGPTSGGRPVRGVDAVVHLAAIPAPDTLRTQRAPEHISATYHVCASPGCWVSRTSLASRETVLELPFNTPPPYIPYEEDPPRPIRNSPSRPGEQMAAQFYRWDPRLKMIGLRFSNVMIRTTTELSLLRC